MEEERERALTAGLGRHHASKMWLFSLTTRTSGVGVRMTWFRSLLDLYVLFSLLIESANSEADPRGFTEDPLSTEEKFREKGKKFRKCA